VESENEWIMKVVNTLTSDSEELLVVLKTASNKKYLPLLLPYLLNDKLADYLPQYLEFVFPDKKAFSKVSLFSIKDYPEATETSCYYFHLMQKCPIAAKYLLVHTGKFVSNIIKTFPDITMKRILFSISLEEIEYLFSVCPDIFVYKDELRDFFAVSSEALPAGKLKTDFCLKNLDRLKSFPPYDFNPYIYSLFRKGNFATLDHLLASDPTIFDFTTADGLPLMDMVRCRSMPPIIKQWIQRNLR